MCLSHRLFILAIVNACFLGGQCISASPNDYVVLVSLCHIFDHLALILDDICIHDSLEDITTNNADKHVVGFYEDRVGTYKNINFRDGPCGQGSI